MPSMKDNLGLAGLGALVGMVAYLLGSLGVPLWLLAVVVGALAAITAGAVRWRDREVMRAVTRFITRINRDGDLSQPMPPLRGYGAVMVAAVNDMLLVLQGMVGKVLADARRVADVSGQLGDQADQVAARTEKQRASAEQMAQAIEQLTTNVYEVAEHASQTARIAQEARASSVQGNEVVVSVSTEIERIAQSVEQSAKVVAALGERSQAISGIVNVIHEIADQTNLLALNAAIEAARAGEQGRGFAVVADEVRKLAERTANATREIGTMIIAIQDETRSAIATIEEGSLQARNGAGLARNAAQSLQAIDRGAAETMEKVDAIAAAIQDQSREAEAIHGFVQQIMQMVTQNARAASDTRAESMRLGNLAANLGEINKVFMLGAVGERAVAAHMRMPDVARQSAKAISDALDAAVASGRTTLEALFDDKYVPIPDTQPQKFHTRFDALTDELFPPVQEPLLTQHAEIIYAGAVDRKGYFPTHNKRYSQPLTGDVARDAVYNRTKRIFDDPVGRRCGSHEQEFLVQTYRRDTGEVLHDVSSPIFVGGRHWGGFRIGYQT